MREDHPDSLASRWISYSGTGRTLIGTVRSRGHGRPGIIYTLATGYIDSYCKLASDTEKLHLYRVLSSNNEEAATELADEVIEAVISDNQDRSRQST
jgi:hypothetical protein